MIGAATGPGLWGAALPLQPEGVVLDQLARGIAETKRVS